MYHKVEEDPPLHSKKLIYLLAIAGRIDIQCKLLAQKLDKERYIYHAYAVLDSLSSSYSMFKFFFEVLNSSNDPKLVHEFLISPQGIATITSEALFLVAFSFLASVYDKEEKESFKKFIATAWPYFRDVMKGLKNAYKAWRSIVQILNPLMGMDLKYMIIPVGLVLGILSAANRFWLRDMVERRKAQMDKNKLLLCEIQQFRSLIPFDRDHYLSRIEYQDEEERIHAFLAVCAGGIIDGLYLYIGVVSLAVLAHPLLIAMMGFSSIYTLSCVISRIYEEYDFQLRLLVTQTKCKFELAKKELELNYNSLLLLLEKENKKPEDWNEIKRLKSVNCNLIENFDNLRKLLKEQTTHSYWTAGLLGMKFGLFAYGVLTSFLFMASSMSLITVATFPPVLLVAVILSGIALMIGFAVYTLRFHFQHIQIQKNDQKEHPYLELLEMKKNLETNNDATLLTADEFQISIKDGISINSSAQFFFQEWLEIFRSLFTGLSKGNSFSNFATTALQDADSQGHYHDTLMTSMLAKFNALFFCLVIGLRALSRGLGRSLLPASTPKSAPNSPEVDSIVASPIDTIKTKPSTESGRKKIPPSFFSRLSFFGFQSTPQNSQILTCSTSNTNLNIQDHNVIQSGIILGLE